MEHRDYGPFWHAYDLTRQHAEMETPMLHVGGWYDTFCEGTIDSFVGLRQNARTDMARKAQRLIMGPWIHGTQEGRRVGEIDFGEGLLGLDPFESQKRWLDHWLRRIDTGLMAEPPVRIFVMGENVWREEQEWPPSRAVPTTLFLHSDGTANTRFGDGTLSARSPETEPPDRYRYDPRNPVPTYGGHACGWPGPGGPLDQNSTQQRQDILVYSTQPLVEDVEVTGVVEVRLFFSTDVVDTDFFATLSDVYPDDS